MGQLSQDFHEFQEDPLKISLSNQKVELEDKVEEVVSMYEKQKRRSTLSMGNLGQNISVIRPEIFKVIREIRIK